MSENLRWALLSTAKINEALIEPIRQGPRSELAAVASRDPERAQAYADQWGIPKAHGSYEALLADPEIDVIYNPLPNSLHAEWTIRAAEAGKHVLCEKPIVLSLEELDRVEAAAEASGVTIFEAFMYLHHPQTRAVQEMVRSGEMGPLRQINSWFNYYLPKGGNIRLFPELGGGSLWDVGVYPNSLAIVMAGGRAPVEVWGQQVTAENDIEVIFSGQMRFEDGAVAHIESAFRTPFRQGAQVVGEQNAVWIDEPWKPGWAGDDSRIVITHADESEETVVFPARSPYLCEVEAMEACVLDGADPVVPLSLSREFLRTILALYESARSGRPVMV
jgi:predicted dehydrogenase